MTVCLPVCLFVTSCHYLGLWYSRYCLADSKLDPVTVSSLSGSMLHPCLYISRFLIDSCHSIFLFSRYISSTFGLPVSVLHFLVLVFNLFDPRDTPIHCLPVLSGGLQITLPDTLCLNELFRVIQTVTVFARLSTLYPPQESVHLCNAKSQVPLCIYDYTVSV